jgi:hypothetical protein
MRLVFSFPPTGQAFSSSAINDLNVFSVQSAILLFRFLRDRSVLELFSGSFFLFHFLVIAQS